MLAAIAAALLLAAASPPDPGDASRAELAAIAARIEWLKERQLAGEDVSRQLEALLVRAQELADRLDRGAPPPPADDAAEEVAPGPDELRERADALRDEADRAAAAVAALDRRIAEARRAHAGGATFSHVVLGARSAPPPNVDHLRALELQRARLASRVAALHSAAAALEADARALEQER